MIEFNITDNIMSKANKPQIEVRRSAETDKLFIDNLSREAFNPFGDYGEVVVKWFDSGYSRTVVATYKEEPAGFAMMSLPFDMYNFLNASEMLAIAVSSEYRGIGVGAALLKMIDQLAYKSGAKMIFLHTAIENKNAIKLFNSAGFRVSGMKNEFYPKGQDAFVMTKEYA